MPASKGDVGGIFLDCEPPQPDETFEIVRERFLSGEGDAAHQEHTRRVRYWYAAPLMRSVAFRQAQRRQHVAGE